MRLIERGIKRVRDKKKVKRIKQKGERDMTERKERKKKRERNDKITNSSKYAAHENFKL